MLGLVLAYVGLEALVAIGPSDLPRLQEIAVYPPVLAFTVAVSLASTLLFGSITALKHALHVDTPMIGAARGSSASRERSTTRNALVVVQVALALVLVVSAALMIRTFQALRDVDPGFSDPATIQTARIWIPTADVSANPSNTRACSTRSSTGSRRFRASRRPALRASFRWSGREHGTTAVAVEGQTLAAGDEPPPRRLKFVSPGYFEAMGTRMIAGRDVTWSDIETGGRVAVISEDFARELAPEPAGALGQAYPVCRRSIRMRGAR